MRRGTRDIELRQGAVCSRILRNRISHNYIIPNTHNPSALHPLLSLSKPEEENRVIKAPTFPPHSINFPITTFFSNADTLPAAENPASM